MRDFFFSTPWWVFVVIAAGAVFMLVTGNNRQDAKLRRIGGIVFLAGVAWFLTSWFVETPPEIARRQTREFVKAVVARNSAKLEQLLHSNASAGAWDKQDIIHGTKFYADQYGLTSAYATAIAIEETPTVCVGRLTVLSQQEGGTVPIGAITSTWELNWLAGDGGWKLKDLTLIGIGNNATPLGKAHLSAKPPGG